MIFILMSHVGNSSATVCKISLHRKHLKVSWNFWKEVTVFYDVKFHSSLGTITLKCFFSPTGFAPWKFLFLYIVSYFCRKDFLTICADKTCLFLSLAVFCVDFSLLTTRCIFIFPSFITILCVCSFCFWFFYSL